MENLKITKSNAIINSSYRLSLNELRIVLYGLSRINPTSNEFPLFHRVNVKELAEFYNVGDKERGSFYDDIKKALITKFWEREFSYYDIELEEVVKRRWLIEVRYGKKDGTLAYHYNPMIKDQLQQLAKQFTSYFLSNVADMKSIYAIRIYEIAIMYLNAASKTKTTFSKDVEQLKHHLDINDKYKNFSDFKKRILEKARKEINKHSNIRLSYEITRERRQAKAIVFTVTRKATATPPSKEEQLLLPEMPNMSTVSIALSPKVIEQGKSILLYTNTQWDIYNLIEQFKIHARKKGMPDNIEAAFLGFVKKKIAQSSK
jgi:plasmid replication initiation protein